MNQSINVKSSSFSKNQEVGAQASTEAALKSPILEKRKCQTWGALKDMCTGDAGNCSLNVN